MVLIFRTKNITKFDSLVEVVSHIKAMKDLDLDLSSYLINF